MRHRSSSAKLSLPSNPCACFFYQSAVMGQCPNPGRQTVGRGASQPGTYPVSECPLGPLWPEQTLDKGTEIMAWFWSVDREHSGIRMVSLSTSASLESVLMRGKDGGRHANKRGLSKQMLPFVSADCRFLFLAKKNVPVVSTMGHHWISSVIYLSTVQLVI